MYKYVLKRLLLTIPILLGVTFIVYSIINMIQGYPGRLIMGISAKQEAVDALNQQLGYDRPFLIRFFSYLEGIILRFDFGTSYNVICMTNLVVFCLSATVVNFHVSGKEGKLCRSGAVSLHRLHRRKTVINFKLTHFY